MKIHYIIIAAILGAGFVKVIDHLSTFSFPQSLSFSIKEGEKVLPVINLTPDGILSIDVARFAKLAEQDRLKIEADKKKSVAVASPAPSPKK